MRTLIMIGLAIAILTGCKQGNEKVITDPPHDHEHSAAAIAVTLNDGKKWKSDSATRENIKLLHDMSTRFADHELAEYKAMGVTLQEGLDKMIKECRMKGKDHEALHEWLDPFAKSVAELKNATGVNQARKVFGEIHQSLESYPDYFE